jgi:hypothetical protein
MSNRGFGFGAGAAAAPVPFGCATYGTNGTYTFTVPSGVSKISVVCVGGGATGCYQAQSNSGGGGNLSYTNCISVTAGEGLTVVVGNAGLVCKASGQPSSVKRGATILICAAGGIWGGLNPSAPSVGAVKYQGGNSAYCYPNRNQDGGTGAAGYAGNGGRANQAGSGGSGGGGYWGNGQPGWPYANGGGGGGGVGLVVQGPSGAAGVYVGCAGGGGGGSGGQPGFTGSNDGGIGGFYGGGGGNGDDCSPGAGAKGGVRIIYGGTGKSYPTNSAP